MALYYALGDALVSEEELHEKQALGNFEEFSKVLQNSPDMAMLEFSTGRMTGENILEAAPAILGERTDFTEVGPGKPLTIEIRNVYTGKYPKGYLLDKSKDMMVTSAMKGIATYNAAPRAINFLVKKMKAGSNYKLPPATDQGTPLIYYTPAVTQLNTTLTLEIGFDEFPDQVFGYVKDALTQVAGIPIFVAASKYLLAAGAITKLVGDLGSRLFDSPPVFKATESINFRRASDKIPQADFRLVTEDNFEKSILDKYRIDKDGQLADSDGNLYNGDIPYIVISLDGHKYDEYASFTPTAASTALLERFYKIKDGQEQPLGQLMDALKIYNDWTFRGKAEKYANELKGLKPDSEDYARKKVEYDAAVANIQDSLLKPRS